MKAIRKNKVALARVLLMIIVMTFMMAFSSVCVFAEDTKTEATQTTEADEVKEDTKAKATPGPEAHDVTADYKDKYKGYNLESLLGKSKPIKDISKFRGDFIKTGDGKYYSSGTVSSVITNENVNDLDLDIKADVGGANELVSGFEPVINLLIGILAWVIVIGLPLITAIDVCYITIPFVREKANDVVANGGAGTKTAKDGSTKLRWISDEAQNAVDKIDLENGRSPLKTYLMSRIGAFVMVAIILYLLIGGQITVVTQLAVKLVSGIMSILSGIGG